MKKRDLEKLWRTCVRAAQTELGATHYHIMTAVKSPHEIVAGQPVAASAWCEPMCRGRVTLSQYAPGNLPRLAVESVYNLMDVARHEVAHIVLRQIFYNVDGRHSPEYAEAEDKAADLIAAILRADKESK